MYAGPINYCHVDTVFLPGSGFVFCGRPARFWTSIFSFYYYLSGLDSNWFIRFCIVLLD